MLDQLSKLGELRDRRIIDEEEFTREKARILAEGSRSGTRGAVNSGSLAPGDRSNEPVPESYMVWAVLTTLFCFLPFGIVALVKASQVDSLWYGGSRERAQAASDSARSWCIAAGATGFALILLVIVIRVSER